LVVVAVDLCDVTLRVLGSFDAQRILEVLSVWGKLTVKEVSEKVSVGRRSAEQILNSLLSVGLVEVKDGRYMLSSSRRVEALKSFYVETVVQNIELYIAKLLSEADELGSKLREAVDKFIKRYYPILKEKFYWSMMVLEELAEKCGTNQPL